MNLSYEDRASRDDAGVEEHGDQRDEDRDARGVVVRPNVRSVRENTQASARSR